MLTRQRWATLPAFLHFVAHHSLPCSSSLLGWVAATHCLWQHSAAACSLGQPQLVSLAAAAAAAVDLLNYSTPPPWLPYPSAFF